MKAINYLQRIRKMDEEINTTIEQIAELNALATKTTSVMGGERVQSSGSQEKMADCVAKIVDKQRQLNDDIDKYVDFKAEARQIVCEACDADCIRLLTLRYFGVYNEQTERTEYYTWERIAVQMNFTYKWVSGGLHQRALSQLQKALDERELLCVTMK